MTDADWPLVRDIYAEGIATGNATLEVAAPDWATFDASHRRDGRLVAVVGDEVVAWFAMSAWSSRDVYRGVAWESVYVAGRARGRGIGGQLLAAGVAESERLGVWTLMAGVLVENAASIALHERAGFRRVGIQERIGRDGTGRWRDVVLLERRSEATTAQ